MLILKNNFKIGTIIQIKTKDSRTIEGLVLPDTTNKKVVIKTDSGYNLGILISNISSSKTISKLKKQKITKKSTQKQNKSLPSISILHTGGTIASEVDYDTGAVIAKFTPEELLAKFPELKKICNINSTLINNMFSEDIRFAHYNKLATAIQKEIKKGAQGIIITHGTDTLAYTSAAISFMLDDLKVPILLVGAQRSSDRGSSDAFMNLLCACKYIVNSNFCDVGICMHEHSDDNSCLILPATKTKKFHSSRRDAFKAINSEPLARIHLDGKYENLSEQQKQNKKSKLTIKPFKENLKVGILKAHPNMFAKEIENYSSGFNGLIIEGTGLGHLPVNETDKDTKENLKIFKAIKKLSKSIPVFMTTQATFGRVNMNVYSSGRKLKEIVSGDYNDILTETAFIKMSWLLSNYPKSKVSELMNQNLRGEITKRSSKKEFL